MRVVVAGVLDVGEARGDTIHLLSMSGAFARAGHDVTLLVPTPKGGTPCIETPGVRFRYTHDATRWGGPRTLNSLWQAIAFLALRAQGQVDVVYSRYSLLSSVFLAMARLVSGARVASEHNGWSADERAAIGQRRLLVLVERWGQLLDARIAHRVRVVVSGIGRLLSEQGIPANRIVTIGNGCDVERVKPHPRSQGIAELGLDETKTYVVFVGNLTVWQGVEIGIRAFATVARSYPDAQLLVVGDGVKRAELEAEAREQAISERVTFLGQVSPDAVVSAISAASICIAPFIRERNERIGLSPIKIREYAAAGRPVVTSSVVERDAASEAWLQIHEPDDVDGLARLLEALLSAPERRDAMSAAAREYAEREFDWGQVASKVLVALDAA